MCRNYFNSKPTSNNYSGYTGITWNKYTRMWKVRITYNYKSMHIGFYKDIDVAIKVYNAIKLACESFKKLGVPSFEVYRLRRFGNTVFKVNEHSTPSFYLHAIIPGTKVSVYIEGVKEC